MNIEMHPIDADARAALQTAPALQADILTLMRLTHAAATRAHLAGQDAVNDALWDAGLELASVHGGFSGVADMDSPDAALDALIRRAGSLRRAAWVFAAEDGADILHTGPRTRVAHAVSAALGHLQGAAEKLRRE